MRPKPKKKTEAELHEKMKKIKTRNVERTQIIKSGDWNGLSAQFDSFAQKHKVSWEDVRLVAGTWGRAYLSVRTPETDQEKFKRIQYDADMAHRRAIYKWEADYEIERRRKANEAYQRALNSSSTKCCPSDCCCRKS